MKVNLRYRQEQVDEILESIEENIASLGDVEYIVSSKIATQYIILSLKKISVYNAHAMLLLSHDKVIPGRFIEQSINNQIAIMDFQIKKSNYKMIELTLTEIKENFSFWSNISRDVLYHLIVKEDYLLYNSMTFLSKDARWMNVNGDLMCKLARSALNFFDILSYHKTNLIHASESRSVKFLLVKILSLQEWVADECLKIYSIDTSKSRWIENAISFLSMAKILYREQGSVEDMQRLEKRVNSVKNKRGEGLLE